jgi:hypothetical protein
MTIVACFASLSLREDAPWATDWISGCALIVVTLITHVVGLGLMGRATILIQDKVLKRRHSGAIFAVLMGVAASLATILHAIEAGMWALAYRALGAVPDNKSAMLYSLGAMTTYGHETQLLEGRWRLMGAVEALNGWLLFGLTTAFLFWLFQKALPNRGMDH